VRKAVRLQRRKRSWKRSQVKRKRSWKRSLEKRSQVKRKRS